jgi:hypothetical protein
LIDILATGSPATIPNLNCAGTPTVSFLIGKALPHLTKDLVNKTMFHNGYRCGTATELDDSDWIREIWMPYNQCEDLVCGACEVCDPVNGCVKTEDGIECSAPVASPNGESSDTAQLVAFGLCTLAAVFAF